MGIAKRLGTGIGSVTLVALGCMLQQFLQEDGEKARAATEPALFAFVKPFDGVGGTPDVRLPPATPPSLTTDSPADAGIPAVDMHAILAANAALVEDKVHRMRVHGASEDEIYRMRAAALGTQAAAHLAAADREEQAWRQRIEAYLVERGRLMNASANTSANISGTTALHALPALRNALFTAEEQERLAAYEAAFAPLPGLP